MPDLRFDPIHKHNVIIAPERNKRPNDSLTKKQNEIKSCPFCPGNENQTPPESYRINDNLNNWIIRTFPNKYPAIIYSENNGISGYQEVLVETPRHSQKFGMYSEKQINRLLGAYKDRICDLKKSKKAKAVIVFKNHGSLAGASLKHPHSQIAALDFIPNGMRQKMESLNAYFRKSKSCYYCDLLKKELFIDETEFFKTVIPKDGRFAYETWILPRRHHAFFEEIDFKEQDNLARVVINIIGVLNKKLDEPAFNLVMHNGIYTGNVSDYFHWHIQIIPRTYQLAGFEWATGLYINPVDPEQAAEELKKLI